MLQNATRKPALWRWSRRRLDDLSDQDVLALAISNEEHAADAYRGFSDAVRSTYPESARIFSEMAKEEDEHRRRLIDAFQNRFGGTMPRIGPDDVRGTLLETATPVAKLLGVEAMRRDARRMEANACRFYHQAAGRTSDTALRRLYGDLAAAEAAHESTADDLDTDKPPTPSRTKEVDDARRRFVLQVVQPGLVGLMDGSVSTLAPVFASAFATHNSWNAFQVGLAASVGAGISMGFAEALADDGKLSGRGAPFLRGLVCGLMTVLGGIGHTLPYLIEDFWTATAIAAIVAVAELLAIAWIQWRYMETPPLAAAAKVMLGGSLVLAAGILIGTS